MKGMGGKHHRRARHQLPDVGSKVAVAASVFLERPLLTRRVKRSQRKDADVRREARRERASTSQRFRGGLVFSVTDGGEGGRRVHGRKVDRPRSRRCIIRDDHDLHRGCPECHEPRRLRWMHRRAEVQVLKATMDCPSPDQSGAPLLNPSSSTGPDPRSHYDPKGALPSPHTDSGFPAVLTRTVKKMRAPRP